MVWPILISVSVTPGGVSARLGEAPHAKPPRLAALDCKKARRDTMAAPILFLLEKGSSRPAPPPSLPDRAFYHKVRSDNVTPVTPQWPGTPPCLGSVFLSIAGRPRPRMLHTARSANCGSMTGAVSPYRNRPRTAATGPSCRVRQSVAE